MNLHRTGKLISMLTLPLRRFVESDRGVAAVEFALVLPIVLLILLACFEVPRFVLIYQRLARTSAGVADLVAQADEPITGNQMQDIFTAAKTMMQPYDVDTNGKIFVSSINNPSNTGVKVTWQKNIGKAKDPKTGTDAKSRVGVPTQAPTIPAALMPGSNEEVLAAEVLFNYQPVFSNLIYSGSQLYTVSYSRPRNKNLMSEPGTADSEVLP